MNRIVLPVLTAALLVPSLAAQTSASRGVASRAKVGDKVPDVTFPQFLNGDGRQKLSEFFGQPVVIDQWGTNCGPCIGGAVPSAIRHDHELSEQGLVTILVECQGSDAENLENFLWKTFPENDCFSCTGTFVPIPDSPGIPFCGVIGVDGKLLWAGNPLSDPQTIEELITAELAKVKKGWGDTAEARKVRALLYGKGDLGGASAAVAAMPEGDARSQLQAEVDSRYASRKQAITVLQDQGRWLDAQAAAKELLKSVGTQTSWTAEVAPLAAVFDGEAGKAELAVAKKLEKVEKQLRDKKRDQAKKALESLVEDAGQTKVGERAKRLLAVLKLS